MQKTLIYDVGLHIGEDTDFYLRMGYQVVAIEANGELVANATRRFEDAITRGKLHVIHGAVAPASMGEKVVFYKNPGTNSPGARSGRNGHLETNSRYRRANKGS